MTIRAQRCAPCAKLVSVSILVDECLCERSVEKGGVRRRRIPIVGADVTHEATRRGDAMALDSNETANDNNNDDDGDDDNDELNEHTAATSRRAAKNPFVAGLSRFAC